MNDRLDIDVHDAVLAAEIAMVTDLMITANRSEVSLCHHTIDAVLNLPGRSVVAVGGCGCNASGARPWLSAS